MGSKPASKVEMSMRSILITGAGNGIGLVMARALSTNGDFVAGLDIDTVNFTDADPQLRFYDCDVTDAANVEEVVEDVVRLKGRVDVLVNNACLAQFKPFLDREVDDIRRELEVNFFGCVNLIRAVLPVMRRQGGGVIHNVSSGVGFTGYPGMAGYTASKGAIESLTRTLALELASDGIVVNVIHPPLTRTRSSAPLGIPLEMMADPEIVGRKLARKIGRRNAAITPDPMSAVGTFANQHFPRTMGRFLSGLARRADTKARSGASS